MKQLLATIAATLTLTSSAYCQTATPPTPSGNKPTGMLCIRRDLVEQALAELAQYDVLKLHVKACDSLAILHGQVMEIQDSLLTLTTQRLSTCDRHMEEAERVILDQTAQHRALVVKTRKERRRLHLIIAALAAGFLITNL